MLVLAPGTLNIWMAFPLSAYPTPFTVETSRGTYWGACIWDAFGIPAMLGEDALISTFCPDCTEPMELRVTDGELEPCEGVAHFAVPARRWCGEHRLLLSDDARLPVGRPRRSVVRGATNSRGESFTLEQAWSLGKRWHADKLSREWTRPTPQQAELIFDSVGLTSDFWCLQA